MSAVGWAAWFDRALLEGAGADLALLADEAPDAESTVAARTAAFHVLRKQGAFRLAALQIDRLRAQSPEAAEALQASIGPNQEPTARLSLAVVLAGHMIDAVDRNAPRFPETATDSVAARISESMRAFAIQPGDRAITSAAAGGDILLAEAALAAGMHVTVCLPFAESRFIESSVSFAGRQWRARYRRLTQTPGVTVREAPQADNPAANPYERVNRWMVYLALASGAKNVRGLLVWDRNTGDGPGGAAHMHHLLREFEIPVTVITPVET